MPRSRAHRRAAECPGRPHRSAGRDDASQLPLIVLIPGEHIAGTTYRNNATRMLGVILKSGTDTRDVHVNTAVEGVQLLPTHAVQEGFAPHDAPRIDGEDT